MVLYNTKRQKKKNFEFWTLTDMKKTPDRLKKKKKKTPPLNFCEKRCLGRSTKGIWDGRKKIII